MNRKKPDPVDLLFDSPPPSLRPAQLYPVRLPKDGSLIKIEDSSDEGPNTPTPAPELKMADRFPKIEDIDGKHPHIAHPIPDSPSPSKPDSSPDDGLAGTSGDGSSFLDRERALLGDDANQFTTANDTTSANADHNAGGGDLLGGDDNDTSATQQANASENDTRAFESAFPAVDTDNQVSCAGVARELQFPRFRNSEC